MMFLSYLILITALCLSAIAAYYSIIGLIAIFAAAVIPIAIMGTALEVSKLVTTVWLHEYWDKAKLKMKLYLVPAVVVLMFITSMGIFGFLSKSHIEQTTASNESVALVERNRVEIGRLEAIIDRAEQKIEDAQTTGTGADANIQAQIDREQKRIDSAYDRVQPLIDEQSEIIAGVTALYQSELDKIDSDLAKLQKYIDDGDIAKAQAMVGSKADGQFGPKTAQAFQDYQNRKAEERKQWVQQIQDAADSPTVKAAREEQARLRSQAEAQIAQSNELINRLRSQLGQDTGVDIDAVIDEQNQKIKAANAEIDTLTEETYALEAEYRKLEAEVGPVKYIAEMIYGEADRDLLEEAVRWVIIIIVVVFDPLAIMMLLAATESFGWAREQRDEKQARQTTIPDNEPDPEHDPDPDRNAVADAGEEPPGESTGDQDQTNGARDPDPEAAARATEDDYIAQEIVYPVPEEFDPRDFEDEETHEIVEETQTEADSTTQDYLAPEEEAIEDKEINSGKLAKKIWKAQNPEDTLKHQEFLYDKGVINELPWEQLKPLADDLVVGNVDFGIKFPDDAVKGDTFIRVDFLPTKLYKYNGQKWIEVDKNMSDSFIYNDEYIDHLIAKISTGEYDVELLNDIERDQIENRLQNANQSK